jgi:formyl-CoA transferase
MGRPELAADPRFAAERDRRANQDELDALISAWTAELDKWEVFEQLQAAGVPCGPVLTAPEVFVDSHLRARGFFERVTHADAGTWDMEGPLFRLSDTPAHIRINAPRFGEHNQYVFAHLLGLPESDLRELDARGVIGEQPNMAVHQ